MRALYLLAALFLSLSLGSCDLIKQIAPTPPKAGEKCTEEGKEVCQNDKTAMVCHNGAWEEMACRGLTGCMGNANDGSCNNDQAQEGDVCNREGDTVCAVDKKTRLECKKYRWTFAENCPGQNGCQVNTKRVRCNQ